MLAHLSYLSPAGTVYCTAAVTADGPVWIESTFPDRGHVKAVPGPLSALVPLMCQSIFMGSDAGTRLLGKGLLDLDGFLPDWFRSAIESATDMDFERRLLAEFGGT